METKNYSEKIGTLIQETRQSRGMTQAELARELGTSQSAVNRIEKGGQNISFEMLARISEVLSSQIVTLSPTINGARYAHHFWHYRAQLLLGFRLG